MLVNDPWPHPRLQPYLLSVFSVVSDDQMHLETTAMSASVRRVHGGSERRAALSAGSGGGLGLQLGAERLGVAGRDRAS